MRSQNPRQTLAQTCSSHEGVNFPIFKKGIDEETWWFSRAIVGAAFFYWGGLLRCLFFKEPATKPKPKTGGSDSRFETASGIDGLEEPGLLCFDAPAKTQTRVVWKLPNQNNEKPKEPDVKRH